MADSGTLRHVVLFGFKAGTTAAETSEIVRRFVALRDQIPGIVALEWGTDNSPEGLAHGLTHAFTLTFATATDRDAYLPHPAHQAFVDWVGPFIEHVTVVDYWAKTAAT